MYGQLRSFFLNWIQTDPLPATDNLAAVSSESGRMMKDSRTGSRFAVNLCPPPADADEEKAPVREKFRGLAFEGMADELENPSNDKEGESIGPQAMNEDTGQKKWDGEQNRRYAQRVAEAVHGMLMAGGVLRDPLLVGAVA